MSLADPPASSLPHKQRGLSLLLIGLVLAATSGALMKNLADDLSVALIIWFRFVGFTLLMLPVVVYLQGRAQVLRPIQPKIQLLRGVLMVSGTACFVIGARTLDYAEAITILYIYPFIITMCAPFLLGEPSRLLSWLGVIGGFFGVLLVARPSAEGLASTGALWVLACGVMVAAQMILNRRLGSVSNPMLTAFWGAVVAAVVVTPTLPWVWQVLEPLQLVQLCLLAALAAISQTLVAFAYARVPAADLAPFSYAEIVAAIGLGYLFFGTLPDALAWLGSAIIVGSGVLVARIQRGRITFRRQPKI